MTGTGRVASSMRPRPKLVAVKLTIAQYERWQRLAQLRSRTMSTMIRILVDEECDIAFSEAST